MEYVFIYMFVSVKERNELTLVSRCYVHVKENKVESAGDYIISSFCL